MTTTQSQEPQRRGQYFNVIMVAPSSYGTFVSVVDLHGQQLFCPLAMFEKAVELLDRHPKHSVILEANNNTTNPVLGKPLFGIHLIDDKTHKVTHTVRSMPPQGPDEDFQGYVLHGKEAEDVFMEAFAMTPERLDQMMKAAKKDPKGNHYFDVENAGAYEKTVPKKPTKPHETLPKPVEHNLAFNSPLRDTLNNRDYATLAQQDFEKAVDEILLCKEGMESIIRTGEVDHAVQKSLDLWNAKLTWRPNDDGIQLPYVGKLPLPIAFSRRIKAILDECRDTEELQRLIIAVRETGTKRGHRFPDDPWDILLEPKDLLQ